MVGGVSKICNFCVSAHCVFFFGFFCDKPVFKVSLVLSVVKSINTQIIMKSSPISMSRLMFINRSIYGFRLSYEGISKSFEPNMERARNLDLFCFIFQRSPLPTPHTCPI